MGESRQELVAWLNDLLKLNITKVEQCGTGAALCQVYDSIFGDVPMHRVKFNVNTEYAYLANFKVLQSTFTAKQIPRTIPVQQLVKCKMQDNLDFLQYTKKYWDQHFPGGDYDAVARRQGQGVTTSGPSASAPRKVASTGAGAARRGVTPTTGPRVARTGGAASAALEQE